MSSPDKIHVGECPQFLYTVKDTDDNVQDIGSANTLNVYLWKPNKSVAIKRVGSLVTDGSDGQFEYVAPTTILNVAGEWKAQGRADLPSNKPWRSDIEDFTVYSNIPEP